MKTKHPLINGLTTLGLTLAGLVVVWFIGTVVIMGIFGDESAAMWGFLFFITLFTPIVLLAWLIYSIRRFVVHHQDKKLNVVTPELSEVKIKKSTNKSDQHDG